MIAIHRTFDPDVLAAEGVRPRAPLCQRCGREATFENPVGVTFRPSWNPLDKTKRGHLDALCAECREMLADRRGRCRLP